MTRTHLKHWRVYANGVDLSGYSRTIGTLGWAFDAEPDAALTDGIKNILLGKCEITAGPVNAFLDNDTAGLWASRAQAERNIMFAMGANAAPAAGDPIFAWKFHDTGYMVEQGAGFVAVNLPLGGASSEGVLNYKKPWGVLLHPSGTETTVNSSAGVDDYGASPPSLGGIFIYHAFTSAGGNVTIKAQESDTSGGVYTDITGATSGLINAATTPQHGMVAIATNYAVKRWIRWQVVFDVGNSVTFAAAFIRNTLPV